MVCFATNCSGETWLPHKDMDVSMQVLLKKYKDLGCRLNQVNVEKGWQKVGWYCQDETHPNKIHSLVSIATKFVELPMSSADMAKFTDWEIVSNWRRGAQLVSRAAVMSLDLHKHFEAQTMAKDMAVHLPNEFVSFELDGESPPSIFRDSAWVQKGRAMANQGQSASCTEGNSIFHQRPA